LSLGKPQEAVAAFTFGLIKEPGNAAAKADRTTAEQCIGRITLAKQVRVKSPAMRIAIISFEG
jgi:hypothetical protein